MIVVTVVTVVTIVIVLTVVTVATVVTVVTKKTFYLHKNYFIFKASALWADAFYKLKCSSVCQSVRPSVRLSVSLFTFEVPFKRLFAPTSRSRMSNIFRDLESLGKSNGKKWSEIGTFLFESGLKSPRKKNFFFADFALENMVETTLPND